MVFCLIVPLRRHPDNPCHNVSEATARGAMMCGHESSKEMRQYIMDNGYARCTACISVDSDSEG